MLNVFAVWLVIALMGLITFALRLSFITLLSRIQLPATVQRGLELIPPAVLSSLVFSDLFRTTAVMTIPLQSYSRLLAAVIAVIVASRTRNVVLTIGVGLATLIILQAII